MTVRSIKERNREMIITQMPPIFEDRVCRDREFGLGPEIERRWIIAGARRNPYKGGRVLPAKLRKPLFFDFF